MKRGDVFSALKGYLISKYSFLEGQTVTEFEVNEDTVLSHIGVTSVDFVLLLIFVENELDVSFEDDDLLMPNDITLGELVDRIMNLYTN